MRKLRKEPEKHLRYRLQTAINAEDYEEAGHIQGEVQAQRFRVQGTGCRIAGFVVPEGGQKSSIVRGWARAGGHARALF